MTHQTNDDDLFQATMAELAEAIIELRSEISGITDKLNKIEWRLPSDDPDDPVDIAEQLPKQPP